MKNCSKIAIIVIIFAALGVLVQIVPASAAVNVTLTVPPIVAPGAKFNVGVTVKNDSTTDAITFNKVAALYVLSDIKYKGPYEVDTTSRTVQPGGSVTFSFPFAIRYTQGCIVPLVVALFKDSYALTDILAGNVGFSAVGVSLSAQ